MGKVSEQPVAVEVTATSTALGLLRLPCMLWLSVQVSVANVPLKDGAVTTIELACADETVAAAPLIVTRAELSKPVPWRVTVLPPPCAPLAGERLEMFGVGAV